MAFAALRTCLPRITSVRGNAAAGRRAWLCALSGTSADDTIFALSSGRETSVSGVAVIRLSGPHSHWATSQLLGPDAKLPETRRAAVRQLVDPESKQPLDRALVLTFERPKSFTGEDVAELHVHGSRAVVRGVLDALAYLGRTRPLRAAEAGEFTRRAFECGRLDLTAVEGLSDLLAAQTSQQRVQALRAADGALEEVVSRWRDVGVRCLAHAEAALDFGDDVDGSVFDEIVPRAAALAGEIQGRLRRDGRMGELVRSGIRVVIVGPPNAGKSTLLNALAQKAVAIVADKPGTTRDVLEVNLDLNGHQVSLYDTAGIRETEDAIEAEGVKRAREKLSQADVAMVLCDAREANAMNDNFSVDMPSRVIRVANKIDLANNNDKLLLPDDMLQLSMLHGGGVGLESLIDKLAQHVSACAGDCTRESPLITRARHRYHLQHAANALQRFVSMRKSSSSPMDIAAEELRIAVSEIGAVIGVVHVEDVLDVVFSEFCIGK